MCRLLVDAPADSKVDPALRGLRGCCFLGRVSGWCGEKRTSLRTSGRWFFWGCVGRAVGCLRKQPSPCGGWVFLCHPDEDPDVGSVSSALVRLGSSVVLAGLVWVLWSGV